MRRLLGAPGFFAYILEAERVGVGNREMNEITKIVFLRILRGMRAKIKFFVKLAWIKTQCIKKRK